MPRATRSARSCRPPLPPARSCTPTGGTATPACGRWVTSIVRAANAPRRSASGCCRARTAPSPTSRPGCTAHTAAPHPATCRPTSTSTSFATTDAAPPTPPSRPCSASVPDTSRPPTAGSSIRPPDPKRNEAGTHFLAYLRGLAQPRDGLPQQPRDVHLREADAVAYLRLREVLFEAQPQDLPLAVAEDRHHRLDGGGVLGLTVARLVAAQRVNDPRSVLVVVGAGAIERVGPVGGCRLVRFEHLLDDDPQVVSDLGRSRRAPELVDEAIGRAVDAQRQFLQVARDPDSPALVAVMALQFSRDRRYGERRERGTACGVEPVDGLQQAHGRDLNEVVQRLVAPVVTSRQLRGEWEKPLHQRVAGRPIVTLAIAREQSPLVERARQPVVAGGVAGAVVRCAPSRPHVPAGDHGNWSARPWCAHEHRR